MLGNVCWHQTGCRKINKKGNKDSLGINHWTLIKSQGSQAERVWRRNADRLQEIECLQEWPVSFFHLLMIPLMWFRAQLVGLFRSIHLDTGSKREEQLTETRCLWPWQGFLKLAIMFFNCLMSSLALKGFWTKYWRSKHKAAALFYLGSGERPQIIWDSIYSDA